MYDSIYAVFWGSQNYRDKKQQVPGYGRVGGGNVPKRAQGNFRGDELFYILIIVVLR